MDASSGYRIKVDTLKELADFLAGVRTALLVTFKRQYGRSLARESTRLLDLHRAGVSRRPADGNPLADATRIVRASWKSVRTKGGWHPDLDFSAEIYIGSDGVLARLVCAGPAYRKAWESRKEIQRFGWHGKSRPSSVSAADWAARKSAWERVMTGPALARCMQMNLVEKTLPVLTSGAVKRFMPRYEDRVTAAAKHIALQKKFGAGASAAAGAEWLRSDEGVAAFADAVRLAAAVIPKDPARDELAHYGQPVPTEAAPAEPRMIDHADIVEASDGRIFVAVPHAGLAIGKRVFVQAGDDHLAVLQDGVHFGHVDAVPRIALDLLRASQTATLVEIQEVGDKRRLKAKHTAMIIDVGLADTFQQTISRWRTPSAEPRERDEWLQA